jgi:hypothetical protein
MEESKQNWYQQHPESHYQNKLQLASTLISLKSSLCKISINTNIKLKGMPSLIYTECIACSAHVTQMRY